MSKEVSYFQFQSQMGYPVFVRFVDQDLESRLGLLMESMGFKKLVEDEFKAIQIINHKTKILSLSEANLKVSRQIDQIGAWDSYGAESVSEFSTYDVYRYKGVGLILMGHNATVWEAAIKDIDKKRDEVKALITRYLSYALAPFGVVSFWGVPVDEGFVVMKPAESSYESVVVDIDNNCFITQDGVKDIGLGSQILRLDESLKGEIRVMKKEELLSFLSVKTCYLSNRGLDNRVKSTLFAMVEMVDGYIYPSINFKPRSGVDL